jgi:hypothetical protein
MPVLVDVIRVNFWMEMFIRKLHPKRIGRERLGEIQNSDGNNLNFR